MSRNLPSLFVSHGAPNLVLHETPARQFLATFAAELPRPDAILVASAHYERPVPTLVRDPDPEMIYDFGGFEPELREMRYAAPGAPAVADRAAALLESAGIARETTEHRGYDHGVWVPLMLLYPDAEIPVAQISIDPSGDPRTHERVGRALAPLREEGVLLIGSGSFTHNLGEVFGARGVRARDARVPGWVDEFADWMGGAIEAGDRDALLDYRARAPQAERNHPTDEHLLPLYVAMGAGGGAAGRRVHASRQHGVLAMDAYAFG